MSELLLEQTRSAREAVHHATLAADRGLLVLAADRLLQLLYRGGQLREVEAVYKATLPAVGQAHPWLLYWRAKALLRLGQSRSVEAALESLARRRQDLNPYRYADVLRSRAAALKDLGRAHPPEVVSGLFAEALAEVRATLAAGGLRPMDRRDLMELQGIILNDRGLHRHHLRRDWQGAWEDLAEARAIHEGIGAHAELATTLHNLADLVADPRAGDLHSVAAARELALEGLQFAELAEDPRRIAELSYLAGRLWRDDDPAASLGHFERAARNFAAFGNTMDAGIAEARAVSLRGALGQWSPEETVAGWRSVLAGLRPFGSNAHAARVGADVALEWGRLELRRGDLAGLAAALDEAEHWVGLPTVRDGRGGDRLRRLRHAAGRATVAARQGFPEAGERLFANPDVAATLASLYPGAPSPGAEDYERIFLEED